MLEKIGVAGLAVGLFQGNTIGATFGLVFAILSFAITYYLER